VSVTRREAGAVALSALAVGAVYVLVLAVVIPLNGLWSGDQGAKLVQIFSLLANRFRSGALIYPGQALDPSGALSPLPALYSTPRDGAYYSIFSYPYAALSAVPFFFLGYAGLYVIPVCATLLTAVSLALIGRELGIARWWRIVPVAGLATPLGFYALVHWEHALAVCCAAAAALLALRAVARPGWRPALLAGLIGGVGYWMRAELLWLAPALLVGLAWAGASRRTLTAAALGLAAPIGLAMLGNLLVFGQPLGPQVAVNYAPLSPGALLASRGAGAGVMLLNPGGRELLPALALGLALAAALLPRLRTALLLALGAASLLTLIVQGAVLHTGVAATAPLALAGLAAFAMRERPGVRLLLGAAVVFAAGVLLTAPNSGGAQWSARYLLVSTALLTPLGLLVLTGGEGGVARAALLLTLLAGLGASLIGVGLLRQSTGDALRVVQVVNAQPARVVLTDVWYGPQLLAPLYLEREVLFIDGTARLREAHDRLRAAGVAELSYVTAQPWDRDTALPAATGLACTRVERFAFELTLLRCATTAGP
jgi:hypothetical protein